MAPLGNGCLLGVPGEHAHAPLRDLMEPCAAAGQLAAGYGGSVGLAPVRVQEIPHPHPEARQHVGPVDLIVRAELLH